MRCSKGRPPRAGPRCAAGATLRRIPRTATSVDGATIAFESAGTTQPAVVLVHGWSCDRRYWRHQLAHFGRSRQVVALDLAGHGESVGHRRSWTMEAYGEDVAAVVAALGLSKVVLVGHSMGGDVAIAAAKLLGNRVRGIVMAETYRSLGGLPPQDPAAVVETFRHDFPGAVRDLVTPMFLPTSDRGVVDFVVEDMAAAPVDVACSSLAHAIEYESAVTAALPALRAPVLAINSTWRSNDVESLASYGVTTLLQDGVGHFLMLEDPDGFNRLLAQALDLLSASW